MDEVFSGEPAPGKPGSQIIIHEQHPHLSLAEIHSELAFYYDHTTEFDAQIAQQDDALKALRAATGESSLQKRLRGFGKSG